MFGKGLNICDWLKMWKTALFKQGFRSRNESEPATVQTSTSAVSVLVRSERHRED
jgi:hypothetical protein